MAMTAGGPVRHWQIYLVVASCVSLLLIIDPVVVHIMYVEWVVLES